MIRMFGVYISIYVVNILVGHTVPQRFVQHVLTDVDKQTTLVEQTGTTDKPLTEDGRIDEINEDYITTSTSGFPVSNQPPIDTAGQIHTSNLDTNIAESRSPFEDTNTNADNLENEGISQVSNNPIMNVLPSMLQHFCKGGNVCLEKQNSSETELPDGKQSCCTDCSCSPDCAEGGDCCFPDKILDNTTECLLEVVPYFDRFNAYRMVTSEPNNGSHTPQIDTCGEKRAAPWGSVYPVFSKSHKRIYKNKHCADAYNVIDGITWNVFITCQSGVSYELMPYLMRHNMLQDKCIVYFEYPGNATDITNLMCFNVNISKHSWCRINDTQTKLGVPFTGDEMMSACYSGLVSPYQVRGFSFANKFCALCEYESELTSEVCSVPRVISEKAAGNFLQLLEKSLLADLSLPPTSQSSLKRACVADKCRPLLCSSGKILTPSGVCAFVAKEWYNSNYLIHLQLSASKPMNISEVFPKRSRQRSIANLQSPWSKRWTIARIICENSPTNDPQMTSTIMISLSRFIQKVRPKDILQNIKRFKNKLWVIEIQGMKYFLKSEFVRNRNLIPFQGGEVITLQKDGVNVSTTLPKLTAIYIALTFSKAPILINELFYCDQVELLPGEFESNNHVLYNKITESFILSGYYSLVPHESNMTAIVCLEYSGMTLPSNAADPCSIMYFIAFVLPFCSTAEWILY